MKRKKTSSIDTLSKLVPEGPSRERFFELVSTMRNAPEDDEQLRFMEIIGFTTLILRDFPDTISKALEKAQSGLTDGQAEAMQRRFEEILKDSIDTPSYKDLRESVRSMKVEREKFQDRLDTVTHAIKQLPAIPFPGTFKTKTVVWTGIVGLLVGALASTSALYLSKSRPSIPVLDSYVQSPPIDFSNKPSQVRDFVDYFEDTLPPYPDPVGIYVVSAGVLEVANEGDKGIVVVALP